jgi:hypothetical protein
MRFIPPVLFPASPAPPAPPAALPARLGLPPPLLRCASSSRHRPPRPTIAVAAAGDTAAVSAGSDAVAALLREAPGSEAPSPGDTGESQVRDLEMA